MTTEQQIKDALAFVDVGPVINGNFPEGWAKVAGALFKHRKYGENPHYTAARILAEAYRTEKGRE